MTRQISTPHRGALRVPEVAERLDVSERMVYKLLDDDAIVGATQVGSIWRVRRDPFDRWMDSDLSVEEFRAREAEGCAEGCTPGAVGRETGGFGRPALR